MKKRHAIISFIGILGILILYFIVDDDKVVNILTLFQSIFAFFTLMIAVVLFDRYQVGSKLNDKTLEIVIEYIEFLKKQTILLETYKYNKKTLEKNGFLVVQFKSDSKCSNMVKWKVFINFKSYFFFYREFIKYISSPWMPKEIVQASKFLILNNNNKNYSKDSIKDNCFILNFCGNDVDNDDLLILENIKDAEQLGYNISKLMETLNKWIKKQASDINFHV